MTSLHNISTACICRSLPERSVCFISTLCKDLVKMRKMIRRVSKRTVRHKADKVIIKPHFLLSVNGYTQNSTAFFCIIKNTLAVSPASACHKQSHGKIFFTIRCRPAGIFLAVHSIRPAEIACHWPFLKVHIGARPLPDAVKYIFTVHLQGHHHAVRHTLCTGIVVSGVFHVAGPVTTIKIKMIRILLIKNFVPAVNYLIFNFKAGISAFFKKISHIY